MHFFESYYESDTAHTLFQILNNHSEKVDFREEKRLRVVKNVLQVTQLKEQGGYFDPRLCACVFFFPTNLYNMVHMEENMVAKREIRGLQTFSFTKEQIEAFKTKIYEVNILSLW